MQGIKLLSFSTFGDNNGLLSVIEGAEKLPFEIKRVYYIYNTKKDFIRGKHAHRKLQQILFCPKGSCDFILDDGQERQTIRLDRPDKGLYICGPVWREFTNFTPDCVVMVLASEKYDEAEYIRNYDEFLKEVKQ